jgi:regulatory protein YycI of two-component signal transduction system YycFG
MNVLLYSQEILTSIMAEQHEKYAMKNYIYDEKLAIRFQAYIRGYLLRKRITDRLLYFNDNQEKVIAIQAWWRCIKQRKQYCKLLAKRARQNEIVYQNKYLNTKTNKINDTNDRLSRYKKHVSFEFRIFYIDNYVLYHYVIINMKCLYYRKTK